MTPNNCSIVRDLLPLFIEGMLSDDTAEYVRDHLSQCAACRDALDALQQQDQLIPAAPPADVMPLLRLRRKLFLRSRRSVIIAAALVLALCCAAFAWVTTPQYVEYTPGLMDITFDEWGFNVAFDDRLTDCLIYSSYDSADDLSLYYIEAWTTRLDRLLRRPGAYSGFPVDPDERAMIFYVQNNGGDDILLHTQNLGKDAPNFVGTVSLPRLVLKYYFLIAVIAFTALCVARFLLRKRPHAAIWLDRILLLPGLYALATLIIMQGDMLSTMPARDLVYILIETFCLYTAVCCGIAKYRDDRIIEA